MARARRHAPRQVHRQVHARSGTGRRLFDAAAKLSATYTIAYIAHVPWEPRAAVAQWQDGAVTVWTGRSQRPFGVRSELAARSRSPKKR